MKNANYLLCTYFAIVIISCNTNQNCVKGMIDFEQPNYNVEEYTQPLSFPTSSGLSMNLANFKMVNGSAIFNKANILAFSPQPVGSGQVIHLNNTSLNFDLRTQTKRIEVEYLDYGGTINIFAHGNANPYIGNLSALPSNLVINGVEVTRYNMQDILNPQGIKIAEKGTFLLKSPNDIGDLKVGGQELYLDNFCFN